MRKALTLVAVLGSLLSGCSGGPKGPEASPISVESTANKVPDGFPSDFPALDGSRVVYSLTVDRGWTVYYDTKASDQEVKKRMASGLVENGWTLTNCATQPAAEVKPVIVITATKPSLFASVSIGVKTKGVPKPFRYAVTMAQFDAPPPASPVVCQ